VLLLFPSNCHVKFPSHFVPVGTMTTELRAWRLDFSAHGSKETANPGTGLLSGGKEWNLPLGSRFGEDTQVNYRKTATKKGKKIKRIVFSGPYLS
jgi:hypothetical protein